MSVMDITNIHIKHEDPFKALLPHLEGNIFHVSKKINWESIQGLNKLIPNYDGKLTTSFGSKSFFGTKGYICLFDYRNVYSEKAQSNIHKCRPTSPLINGEEIVIFIMNEGLYNDVVDWKLWEKEGAGTNVVPHIEVGYKGEIGLNLVDKILIVSYEEDPNSLAYMMKLAMGRVNQA